MLHDAAILGMLLFNTSERDLQSIHSGLYAGLEDGTLRPVISKEMPLARAAQAHKEIMESGARGKIVLIP
jgi:NADPH2:quinone reductase